MTLRCSRGKGGGRVIERVRSFSRPSMRRVISTGERVAENKMVEEAARKVGAKARAGSRQTRARRRDLPRLSITQVKPGPNRFKMAMNRCQAKCKSRIGSSGGASFISCFQER